MDSFIGSRTLARRVICRRTPRSSLLCDALALAFSDDGVQYAALGTAARAMLESSKSSRSDRLQWLQWICCDLFQPVAFDRGRSRQCAACCRCAVTQCDSRRYESEDNDNESEAADVEDDEEVFIIVIIVVIVVIIFIFFVIVVFIVFIVIVFFVIMMMILAPPRADVAFRVWLRGDQREPFDAPTICVAIDCSFGSRFERRAERAQ
jgi:hypothetical protein